MKTRREEIETMIGELILFIPLIVLFWVSDIIYPGIASMLIFFICKWQYQVNGHFHFDEAWKCVVCSYGTFILIGVLDAGIYALAPEINNQPMIPVFLAVSSTWMYAAAGDKQAENQGLRDYKAHKEADPSKPPFRCKTSKPSEIRERAIRHGRTNDDIVFLIKAHRLKGYIKRLSIEYGISENSVKEKKRLLTKIIESPLPEEI